MMTSNTPLLRIMTPALALCLCAGVATAQNQTERERERERQEQRQDQRERQDRQPVDENHPLWAHPVDDGDWSERDRWTRQDSREAREQMRTRDRSEVETYRAAYWEGYHDGFHDDEFGYDHWSNEWEREYSSAYTDGYYDGYYDQQLDYEYNPNYYLYAVAIPVREVDQENQAERRRAEQKRQEDKMRARGDRMGVSAGSARMQASDLEKIGALKLVRGDVSDVSEAERSDHPDHTVLRVKFQDREDVIADFGPNMSREEVPFKKGDRISLIGYHAKSQQGETIVVSQIVEHGNVYNLRGAQETLQDRDRTMDGGADRQRDSDRNRPGGG